MTRTPNDPRIEAALEAVDRRNYAVQRGQMNERDVLCILDAADAVDPVRAEVAGLRSQLDTARRDAAAELAEAAEDIANWGAYAGDYFAEKWDLAGDIARVKAAAERFGAVQDTKGTTE